jgi:hypothetical protein
MSERVDVTVTDNPERSRFEAIVDGEVAGFVQYRRGSDGSIDLHHTEVDDGFEGKGVGTQLARGALDAVRASGDRLVPTCPFIKRYIERNEEYADLVA